MNRVHSTEWNMCRPEREVLCISTLILLKWNLHGIKVYKKAVTRLTAFQELEEWTDAAGRKIFFYLNPKLIYFIFLLLPHENTCFNTQWRKHLIEMIPVSCHSTSFHGDKGKL